MFHSLDAGDSPDRIAPDRTAEEIRAAVDGLAAGVWERDDGVLILRSFSAKDEMPPDVQGAFRSATARVGLDRTDLAIVRAVVEGDMAVAEPPPVGEEGSGSPAWLRRFAARRSIALPLRESGRIVGAIAVAFSREVSEFDPEPRTLRALAERLVAMPADGDARPR